MSETRNSSLLGKITVLVVICCCSLPAQGKYGGGTGEPNDPYLIYDANQMNTIGADSNDWDKCFLLCADIDLSGYTGTSFNIIGTSWDDAFTGVFDGNGKKISNFTYASTGRNGIGLFGYVTGEIKDLGLIDPNVDAGTGYYVGSLVGYNYGTITNCYVEGGTIAGYGFEEYYGGVGGLVGRNGGTISNCYSTGSVSGSSAVGGLVGGNSGTITNCYSTAGVSGDWAVGGLVGDNDGTITNSYATATVSGATDVGGLVGQNEEGTISNCYSSADVSGNGHVGGLVGDNDGTISNSYSTGSVSGTSYVGGLVGHNDEQYAVVTASFWDTQTSGQATSDGGTGKTTAQMQTARTFIAWVSCEPVWTIDEGKDYPRLVWENAPGEPITPQLCLGGGSGTQADPYLIYTAKQLNAIGLFPCLLDKHFLLCADIDLSAYTGTSFNIIGASWPNVFRGVFDGSGHTISNFTYSSTETDFIGLFGYVDGGDAEIKNLGLIDPNVEAGTGNRVGLLVGRLSRGTISGCYAEGGSVSGSFIVGGLVGFSWGTINNCYSTGSVSGTSAVGGLVGVNFLAATIIDCYATGSVTGNQNVGGLVGVNLEGEITTSFWDTETSGQNTSAGGTSKTTAEMQMQVTFMDAGWDFENIWWILEGAGYPRLWWEEKYGGGTGEPNDPYLIFDANQMNAIGANPGDWDKNFLLCADIDLSGFTGTSFNIIGTYYPLHPFIGVFDGSGHTISNFTYDSNDTDYIGLFGYVGKWGVNEEIKNLGLFDPNLDAGTGRNVGSLVGYLVNGTITNCYVQGGSVLGAFDVGGLVGHNWSTIDNCYSAGSVSGRTNVGGLVGWNNSGTITNCYSTSSVSGNNNVGGLMGIGGGTITNCYATASVSGKHLIGGLIGENYYGTISNCYATGSVAGTGSWVGGLVGVNWGVITNCYSAGSVSGNNNVGGLVGDKWQGEVTYSFWDTETSGQTASAGGTGLPTAQMQTQSTFTDAGWDFVGERINGSEDIWMMTCEGMSYPKLSWWQPVLGDYFCPDGVDMIDMEHLALHWLDTGCDETNDYCDWAEISNDSTIDFTDFAILADNWLAGR